MCLLEGSKSVLQHKLKEMSTIAANKRTMLLPEQRFQLTECLSKVVGVQNPKISKTIEERKKRLQSTKGISPKASPGFGT